MEIRSYCKSKDMIELATEGGGKREEWKTVEGEALGRRVHGSPTPRLVDRALGL